MNSIFIILTGLIGATDTSEAASATLRKPLLLPIAAKKSMDCITKTLETTPSTDTGSPATTLSFGLSSDTVDSPGSSNDNPTRYRSDEEIVEKLRERFTSRHEDEKTEKLDKICTKQGFRCEDVEAHNNNCFFASITALATKSMDEDEIQEARYKFHQPMTQGAQQLSDDFGGAVSAEQILAEADSSTRARSLILSMKQEPIQIYASGINALAKGLECNITIWNIRKGELTCHEEYLHGDGRTYNILHCNFQEPHLNVFTNDIMPNHYRPLFVLDTHSKKANSETPTPHNSMLVATLWSDASPGFRYTPSARRVRMKPSIAETSIDRFLSVQTGSGTQISNTESKILFNRLKSTMDHLEDDERFRKVNWNAFKKRFGEESAFAPVAKDIFLDLGFIHNSSDENALFLPKENYNHEKFLKVLAIIFMVAKALGGHEAELEFRKIPLKDQEHGIAIAELERQMWLKTRF